MLYASIIIDISHENVDRTFQYRIPAGMEDSIRAGVRVRIPFGAGNRLRNGYVVEVTEQARWEESRIKDIAGLAEGSVDAEAQLIELARWMKERYGSTMNQALKTVLPVKQAVRRREDRCLVCRLGKEELENAVREAAAKKYRARERLLRAFEENPRIPYTVAVRHMNLSAATLKPMLEKGMIAVESRTVYRGPLGTGGETPGGGIRPDINAGKPGAGGNQAGAGKLGAGGIRLGTGDGKPAGGDKPGIGSIQPYTGACKPAGGDKPGIGSIQPYTGACTQSTGAETPNAGGSPAGAGGSQAAAGAVPVLNPAQRAIAEDFRRRYDGGDRRPSLIFGVTGSGKTEVYMEMIDHVLSRGKQAIVLIPEIALTYQTVLRFYRRFGDRIAVVNSRLSAGERYDQFERARTGQASVMIGPRSALFTPFTELGLIILDEEHETAYKSELSPRYHARQVAEKRAELAGAALVMGSATPSLEAYSGALSGRYALYRLPERAKRDSRMARVQVVDLRAEMRDGNRSVFSRTLRSAMDRELREGNQIMLFLNRRGYANFVSCRSCGEAVKCPHCDVTLTLHRGGRLVCHYCNYQIPTPKKCPSCGSPYIAAFGTGTQKVEELTRQMFPRARVLRMDLDTTSRKGGHEEILSAFADGEADILVGTQMIVKGHDFPRVTLVGILAADLSLYAPDFRCGERTFQLLTQAAGRAGRDRREGRVIIQTYSPEHYSIVCAARQDYEAFYRKELAYRQVLHYPPEYEMLSVCMSCRDERLLDEAMDQVHGWVMETDAAGELELIGPAEAPVYKVNDIYRKILYLKHKNYDILVRIRDKLEQSHKAAAWAGRVTTQFDFA